MESTDKKIEVVRLFYELNKILKHNMHKDMECIGITVPQSFVIGTLVKSGEMKISELSNKVNLSNSTISGIIDRLENQQLVTRTRSQEDRRIVYVKATPKVHELYQGIYQKAEKSFGDLLSSGTPEELEKIIVGLNTLKKVLKDSNK